MHPGVRAVCCWLRTVFIFIFLQQCTDVCWWGECVGNLWNKQHIRIHFSPFMDYNKKKNNMFLSLSHPPPPNHQNMWVILIPSKLCQDFLCNSAIQTLGYCDPKIHAHQIISDFDLHTQTHAIYSCWHTFSWTFRYWYDEIMFRKTQVAYTDIQSRFSVKKNVLTKNICLWQHFCKTVFNWLLHIL